MNLHATVDPAELEAAALQAATRRVRRRLIPLLILLYVVAYLIESTSGLRPCK